MLVGLRATRRVPAENILFALVKLALLPMCIAAARRGVFVARTAPVALTIIAVTWYLFDKRIPELMAASTADEELPLSLPSTRELYLLAGAQHATLLFSVFSPSIVTLIVVQRLGAVANAHYNVPSLITSSLGLLSFGIVRSFLVEASHEPQAIRRHSNTAIRATSAMLLRGVVIGVMFAPEFLRVFGATYAAHGTTLLGMLLLSLSEPSRSSTARTRGLTSACGEWRFVISSA